MTNGDDFIEGSIHQRIWDRGDKGEVKIDSQNTPLTKREYIAAAALQGLLADPASDPQQAGYDDGITPEYAQSVASSAVQYADALIEALNK